MKKSIYIFATICLFVLSACYGKSKLPLGQEFVLEANPVVSITFSKEENRFYGMAQVNRYFGTYKVDGNKLQLSTIGSTMMAAPIEEMNAEQSYLKTLGDVVSFKTENNNLILQTPSQDVIFVAK